MIPVMAQQNCKSVLIRPKLRTRGQEMQSLSELISFSCYSDLLLNLEDAEPTCNSVWAQESSLWTFLDLRGIQNADTVCYWKHFVFSASIDKS